MGAGARELSRAMRFWGAPVFAFLKTFRLEECRVFGMPFSRPGTQLASRLQTFSDHPAGPRTCVWASGLKVQGFDFRLCAIVTVTNCSKLLSTPADVEEVLTASC